MFKSPDLVNIFQHSGVVRFRSNPDSLNIVSKLREELANVPEQIASHGEPEAKEFDLKVKRIVADMAPPGSGDDLFEPILQHMSSARILDLIKQLLSLFITQEFWADFEIRRVQSNVLESGNFIGEHIDAKANPNYHMTFIVFLSSAYRGGDYVVKNKLGNCERFIGREGDVILTDIGLPHEILEVSEGCRETLVFFIKRKS